MATPRTAAAAIQTAAALERVLNSLPVVPPAEASSGRGNEPVAV